MQLHSGSGLVPFSSTEFIQPRFSCILICIFTYETQLFHRNKKLSVISIVYMDIVPFTVIHSFDFFYSLIDSDSMTLMYYIIANSDIIYASVGFSLILLRKLSPFFRKRICTKYLTLAQKNQLIPRKTKALVHISIGHHHLTRSKLSFPIHRIKRRDFLINKRLSHSLSSGLRR